MKKNYLLFDIGATRMRLAAYSQGAKTFGKPKVFETPKKYEAAMKLIKTEAVNLCGKQIAGSAGGLAGVLDKSTGIIRHRGNLKDWQGKFFVHDLQKIIKGPVLLDNDTAVVGLGEAVFGSGKGFGIAAYVTVSTGVNGARIVNKKIDPTVYGFETGKQIIDESGKTLEWYIAGSYLEKRFHKTPHEIKNKKIWKQVAGRLAVGLHNTIVHWSPEILVLGGGVMNEMELENIVRELKKIKFPYPKLPVVKRAKLGGFGGLYGAMHLIKSNK